MGFGAPGGRAGRVLREEPACTVARAPDIFLDILRFRGTLRALPFSRNGGSMHKGKSALLSVITLALFLTGVSLVPAARNSTAQCLQGCNQVERQCKLECKEEGTQCVVDSCKELPDPFKTECEIACNAVQSACNDSCGVGKEECNAACPRPHESPSVPEDPLP